jgi:surface antigen
MKPIISMKSCALVVPMLVALGAAPAHAQMINPFLGYKGPTLTQQDYKIAGEVVGKLLNEKPPTVGNAESWSNPASGNSGKFTILDIFTKDNMPCRKVKADTVYAKGANRERSFTLDACQVPDGKWKIAS